MSGLSIKRVGRNFSIRISLFYIFRGIFFGLIFTFFVNIRKLECLRSKQQKKDARSLSYDFITMVKFYNHMYEKKT